MKNYGPVHRILLGYQVVIESKMGKAVGWRILQIKKSRCRSGGFLWF
tara:strand:+ start:95 stop:235 length:141 start_codon:yes stop_codon:yes gene_type:complete